MHDGHRERMRKKMIEGDALYNHELLEILLYATNSRCDTNPIAHNLIKEFGSLSAVFDADYDDLIKVEGVGATSATLIKTIPRLTKAYIHDKTDTGANKVCNSDTAFEYLFPYYVGVTEEIPGALMLTNSGKILGFEKLGDGGPGMADISSRKLISAALKYNAAKVVLVHNHPSGVAIPSRADIKLTVTIKNALSTIGVALIDHMIIAGRDYISMAVSDEYSYLFN